MIVLIVNITVKREFVPDFILETSFVQSKSRCEVGCEQYDVLQDVKDPTKFTFIEAFKDSEAFDFHKSTAHLNQWKINTAEMVVDKSVTSNKYI